ncbi:MAG: MBL fold metallo-hydrolase [Candidatus Aminicenantia bacterium]
MISVNTIENEVVQLKMARSFLKRPLYFTACYFVDGLLIDTGMINVSKELLKELEKFEIAKIVNTHAHEDHIGNNLILQKKYDLEIKAHEKAIEIIEDPTKLNLHLYQKFLFGLPKPSKATPIKDKINTKNYSFEAVYTPGHSKDHICLYERSKGWLFSGDAFIGGLEKVLRADYNIQKMISTYKKLKNLSLKVIFTGYGKIVYTPKEKINIKISYLEEEREKILALFNSGLTEKEIAKKVFKNDSLIRFVTGGHFSSLNLVRSFIANFKKL